MYRACYLGGGAQYTAQLKRRNAVYSCAGIKKITEKIYSAPGTDKYNAQYYWDGEKIVHSSTGSGKTSQHVQT